MKCPKCSTASLKQVKTTGQNLILDTCPQCKGIWFDQGELNHTFGRAINEENVPKYASEVKNALCPKCNVSLFEYCYPSTTTLVDGCKQCQGTWLDDTEWKQIKDIVNNKNKITCPKCHATQALSNSCQQCGIIFEKHKKQKDDRAALARDINSMFESAFSYQIKQELEWLEILTSFERKNRYSVTIMAKKNYTGYVTEHSRSIFNLIGRQILGRLRPAEILFMDSDNRLITKMKKQFKLYFHQINMVENNNVSIGSIKRKFHILRTNYDIENRSGKTIIKIKGPYFFIPFIDRTFTILKNDQEVGSITKKWKGFLKEYFTDADSFHIRIDRTLDVKEKLLLFGAVFLIDFVSFENNQS